MSSCDVWVSSIRDYNMLSGFSYKRNFYKPLQCKRVQQGLSCRTIGLLHILIFTCGLLQLNLKPNGVFAVRGLMTMQCQGLPAIYGPPTYVQVQAQVQVPHCGPQVYVWLAPWLQGHL